MFDTQSEHKAAKILESSLFELWTRWFVSLPAEMESVREKNGENLFESL